MAGRSGVIPKKAGLTSLFHMETDAFDFTSEQESAEVALLLPAVQSAREAVRTPTQRDPARGADDAADSDILDDPFGVDTLVRSDMG